MRKLELAKKEKDTLGSDPADIPQVSQYSMGEGETEISPLSSPKSMPESLDLRFLQSPMSDKKEKGVLDSESADIPQVVRDSAGVGENEIEGEKAEGDNGVDNLTEGMKSTASSL